MNSVHEPDAVVERLRADVRAAYAERDEVWERKAAALRERDEARRELAEVQAAAERVRAVWGDWRRRLGGSFPRAMVQEIDDAMDARPAELKQLQDGVQAVHERVGDAILTAARHIGEILSDPKDAPTGGEAQ